MTINNIRNVQSKLELAKTQLERTKKEREEKLAALETLQRTSGRVDPEKQAWLSGLYDQAMNRQKENIQTLQKEVDNSIKDTEDRLKLEQLQKATSPLAIYQKEMAREKYIQAGGDYANFEAHYQEKIDQEALAEATEKTVRRFTF